jgi:hypothetical protein
MRRARATTATVMPCARYPCPRVIEAPGRGAAGSGFQKLRTVPAAILQRRAAGALRRGRRRRGLHDARRGAPRREIGTLGLPGSPRQSLNR